MAKFKDKETRDFTIRLTNDPAREDYKSLVDFNKIQVGPKTLRDDVIANLSVLKKVNPAATKEDVLNAIKNDDLKALREYSEFFYKTSGIYSRLCRYMAYIYRYDWMIVPVVHDNKLSDDKVIEGFYKSITYLDNCGLKKLFGEIALKVIKNGSYYGYKIEQKGQVIIQELPADYCRSRYYLNNKPAVEFNVKFFDDSFRDANQKMRVLKMFPKDIQKGYMLYKQGKLSADYAGDTLGWYMLDPEMTVKFNLNSSDAPLFVSIIPSIIELDEAQELDKKKMKQKLLKLIIQKMPMDKNGDLVFDPDEAQALHSNAVKMLAGAIGVDVLTTFAEIDVADLSDRSNVTSVDELTKVERAVYNEAGVSQMQFNTDGNLALEKSIANDEASMTDLLLQFQDYAMELLKPFNKNVKRLEYKFQILPTTIYNYKDLSKLYKEQMTLGFSKLLPQVALGQSQSVILATAYFENNILDLNSVFVPPQMSSTISANQEEEEKSAGSTTTNNGETDEGGRPEKTSEEKSERTIQNEESSN